MNTNPFQILGLDIMELKGIPIDQLSKMIRTQYLALQHVYHTDVGGDEKKTRLVNWAKDELSSPEKVEKWVSYSLKAKKSSIREALNKANEDLATFKKVSIRFLLAAYYSSANQYVDMVGMQKRRTFVCRAMSMEQNAALLAGLGENLSPEKKKEVRMKERERLINRTYYELCIKNGKLFQVDYKGREVDISSRLMIGIVSQGTIIKTSGGSSEPIYRWLQKVCPIKAQRAGMQLPFRYHFNEAKSEMYTDFSHEKFVSVFPFLTYRIKKDEDSWLFSMRMENGRPVFRLEGKVSHNIPKHLS